MENTSSFSPENDSAVTERALYDDPDLRLIAETDEHLADRLRALQLADEMIRQNPGNPTFVTLRQGMDEAVRGYAQGAGYRWGEQPPQGDS